jgi:hypothetical protein
MFDDPSVNKAEWNVWDNSRMDIMAGRELHMSPLLACVDPRTRRFIHSSTGELNVQPKISARDS